MKERLGILNTINAAINELQNYSATTSFYHETQESKQTKALSDMLLKMIQDEK